MMTYNGWITIKFQNPKFKSQTNNKFSNFQIFKFQTQSRHLIIVILRQINY